MRSGNVLFVLLALLAVAVDTSAGTRYWDGGTTNIPGTGNSASDGGSGSWATTIQNWDAGGGPHTNWVNANNDTAVFGGTAGVVTNQGVTVGGLIFTAANYLLVNSNVTFEVAGTISNSADATIASGLTGTEAITKAGAGTLTLSGTNTYSGGTVVAGGTLALVGIAAQPASSTLAISNGATVRISASADSTWPATTVIGSGTLVADTAVSRAVIITSYNMGGFTGVLDVLASGTGKIALFPPFSINNGATIKVENGATAYYGWTGQSLGCSVELWGSGNTEGFGALRLDNNTRQNGPVLLKANSYIGCNGGMGYIGGVISDGGAGYGFTKVAGYTLVLQATNTYSGSTVVKTGTLQCDNPDALGSGGNLSINNGAVLNLNYSGNHNVSSLTLGGTLMPFGVYGSTNSPATYQDPHFSGTGTVTVPPGPGAAANRWWDGGSTNISGNGNSASGGGSGTWNTTLKNWDAGAVAHTNWVNAGNDTAVFGGTAGTVTNQGVTVSGLTFMTANYVLTNSTVTFGAAGTIFNYVPATIASVLAGSVSIAKFGTGTLTLTATNTYSGPTIVSAGTLTVATSGRLGTNNLTIASGATVVVQQNDAISSNACVDVGGILNLAAGVTNTVRRLYFNGICQQAGLWNAARDATHFSGSGSLIVAECPYAKMIPLRSPTYRGYPFCASLTGSAIKSGQPYEILFDTGSWDISIPYGSLNKSNITVLTTNVTDCWGEKADMVQGQLTLMSADGTTAYTIDDFIFYARRNADGSEAADDRGQSGGNSIMGAFPSIWPAAGRPSLPYLLAQKYSPTNNVGLGIVSEPLKDFNQDWGRAKSYLQLGSDPQITTNLNWRSDSPVWTGYNGYCPYRVPGFGITFRFKGNVPDIVVTGLNATVDTGASILVLRPATNDPQRSGMYSPYFTNISEGWWPGTAYETNALTMVAGQDVQVQFTSDTGKSIYYHYETTGDYSRPSSVTVGDWCGDVPWPVSTDAPRTRFNLGNTIYFFCPVYFWDVSNNRVGVSDTVDNTLPWGVSLDDVPATAITTNSAALNATLSCSGSSFDIYAYWNTVNGGTSATQWSNCVYVGSWTNVLSTNVSCSVSALAPNTTYYFRFLASNAVSSIWAPSVLNFKTEPSPVTELTWDANGTGSGVSDGAGIWNTTSNTWWNGSTNVNWGDNNAARIGSSGTGGLITLGTDITAGFAIFTNFIGTYTLSNNTLAVVSSLTVASSSGNVQVKAGLAGTGGVRMNGSNTLTLSGTNTYSGGTAVSSGTLSLVGVAAQPASSTLAISSGATVRISAPVDSTWPATTVTGAGTLVADTATGRSLTLTSYNLGGFTGILNVTASGGQCKIGMNPPFILNQNATIKIDNGATTYYGWQGLNLNCNVELWGAGNTEGYGALRLEGNARQSGPVVLKANSSIGGTSGLGTIDGVISDGGLGYGFTKASASTLVLNNTNTYSGTTTISGGTLKIGGSGALGSGSYAGAISVGSGTIFQYSSSAAQNLFGVISGAGSLIKDTSSGTLTLSATNTYTGSTTVGSGTLKIGGSGTLGAGSYAGTIAISNGATFCYSSSATQNLSGVISGAGALVKDTSSTLALSGTNTYTGGTTVSAGTLVLMASGSHPSSGALAISNSTLTIVAGTGGRTLSNNVVLSRATVLLSGQDNVGSGGTIIVDSNGVTHVFTSSGSLVLPVAVTAKELLVGGGGGGGGGTSGSYYDAGGGGGEVKNLTAQVLSVGTNAVTVGTGGAGANNADGGNGTAASIGSNSATFGLGAKKTAPVNGGTSGSGKLGGGVNSKAAGGGGGDSTAGNIGVSTTIGGVGGTGTVNTAIAGLASYGYGHLSGGSAYFGGGGGGSAQTTGGNGGLGGGGKGGTGVAGTAGTPNTGGGGGGYAAGGTGLAVVQYPFSMNAGTVTLAGGIDLQSTSILDAYTSGGLMDVTGAISTSTSTGGLTIASSYSAGGVIRFGTNNTYLGNTTISNGAILRMNAVNAMPFGNGKGDLFVAGTFDLNGNSTQLNGLSGSGVVDGTSGTPTLTAGNNNASSTFGGVIRNTGGALALNKTGNGALTLSGSNTFSGVTTISAGTLKLGASHVLPDVSAVSLGAGALDAATYTDALGALDVTGNATINLGKGGRLAFAASNGIDWSGGTLRLTGSFVSGFSIRFGSTSTGLTSVQLVAIACEGFGHFSLDASGYLVATRGTMILVQ